MAQMMTFRQRLEAGYKIPEVVDGATQTLIKDWFGLRYTPDNFEIYFDRACKLYYPYYMQLLRLDATVTDYDWFVSHYLERQTDTTNKTESSRNTEKNSKTETTRDGSTNSTSTTEGTDSRNTTRDYLGERLTKHTGTESTAYKGGETDAHTGDNKKTLTGTDTTAHKGSETDTHTGDNSKVRTGSESQTEKGSETNTTDTARTSESADRTTEFQRTTPMSAEYSAGTGVSPAIITNAAGSATLPTDSINRPNITNPTATADRLTQSGGGSSDNSKSVTTFDGRGRETTYNSVTDTDNYNEQNIKSFQNRTDETTHDTTETTTYNENNIKSFQDRTDTTTHDTTDTESYNGRQDLETVDGTNNSTVTNTGTTKDTTDTTGTETGTETGTDTATGNSTAIESGRSEELSQMAMRARDYIIQTQSWRWLMDKLDRCFIGVYEV